MPNPLSQFKIHLKTKDGLSLKPMDRICRQYNQALRRNKSAPNAKVRFGYSEALTSSECLEYELRYLAKQHRSKIDSEFQHLKKDSVLAKEWEGLSAYWNTGNTELLEQLTSIEKAQTILTKMYQQLQDSMKNRHESRLLKLEWAKQIRTKQKAMQLYYAQTILALTTRLEIADEHKQLDFGDFYGDQIVKFYAKQGKKVTLNHADFQNKSYDWLETIQSLLPKLQRQEQLHFINKLWFHCRLFILQGRVLLCPIGFAGIFKQLHYPRWSFLHRGRQRALLFFSDAKRIHNVNQAYLQADRGRTQVLLDKKNWASKAIETFVKISKIQDEIDFSEGIQSQFLPIIQGHSKQLVVRWKSAWKLKRNQLFALLFQSLGLKLSRRTTMPEEKEIYALLKTIITINLLGFSDTLYRQIYSVTQALIEEATALLAQRISIIRSRATGVIHDPLELALQLKHAEELIQATEQFPGMDKLPAKLYALRKAVSDLKTDTLTAHPPWMKMCQDILSRPSISSFDPIACSNLPSRTEMMLCPVIFEQVDHLINTTLKNEDLTHAQLTVLEKIATPQQLAIARALALSSVLKTDKPSEITPRLYLEVYEADPSVYFGRSKRITKLLHQALFACLDALKTDFQRTDDHRYQHINDLLRSGAFLSLYPSKELLPRYQALLKIRRVQLQFQNLFQQFTDSLNSEEPKELLCILQMMLHLVPGSKEQADYIQQKIVTTVLVYFQHLAQDSLRNPSLELRLSCLATDILIPMQDMLPKQFSTIFDWPIICASAPLKLESWPDDFILRALNWLSSSRKRTFNILPYERLCMTFGLIPIQTQSLIIKCLLNIAKYQASKELTELLVQLRHPKHDGETLYSALANRSKPSKTHQSIESEPIQKNRFFKPLQPIHPSQLLQKDTYTTAQVHEEAEAQVLDCLSQIQSEPRERYETPILRQFIQRLMPLCSPRFLKKIQASCFQDTEMAQTDETQSQSLEKFVI